MLFCHVVAIKVSTYIDIQCTVVMFTFSGPNINRACRVQHLFGNRVSLNLGLREARDVASAVIAHEQPLLNQVCSFQTLDAVYPMDLF